MRGQVVRVCRVVHAARTRANVAFRLGIFKVALTGALCRAGGDDILLTIDNVEEYVTLLPKVILVDSVRQQLDAFRSGFRCAFLGIALGAALFLFWRLCVRQKAQGQRECAMCISACQWVRENGSAHASSAHRHARTHARMRRMGYTCTRASCLKRGTLCSAHNSIVCDVVVCVRACVHSSAGSFLWDLCASSAATSCRSSLAATKVSWTGTRSNFFTSSSLNTGTCQCAVRAS